MRFWLFICDSTSTLVLVYHLYYGLATILNIANNASYTLIGRCGCSLGFPKKPLLSAHFFGKKMCVCNITDLEPQLEATKKHKKLQKSGNQSIKLMLYFTCNERIFEIQNNHSSNISFLKSKVFQRGQNVYKDQKI